MSGARPAAPVPPPRIIQLLLLRDVRADFAKISQLLRFIASTDERSLILSSLCDQRIGRLTFNFFFSADRVDLLLAFGKLGAVDLTEGTVLCVPRSP